jgi:hypothetical protein
MDALMRAGGRRPLLDRDNLDFVAVHLDGLTDPLSNEPTRKWGHIGDRSAAGIRLVLADDAERLAPTIVALDRDAGAKRDHACVNWVRLENCARHAFREIPRVSCRQFQSATALVGVGYRLRGFERLVAAGESLLERMEAGLGHEVGMGGNRPRRQAHRLRGLRAFLPDERNAHGISP